MVEQVPLASNGAGSNGPGRSQLSRERVALEALAIIDRDGLSGLSMRKLGTALGVEAMSIYHYVSSKDDLLDAVLDLLYRQVEIIDLVEHDAWESVFVRGVRSFNQVLLDHPHTVALFVGRPASKSREGFDTFLSGYTAMRRAGISPADAHCIVNLAVAFLVGNAVLRAGAAESGRSVDLVPADLPTDGSIAEFVLSGRELTDDVLFERGLTILVQGLRSNYGLA
ncbi:MAG: TetR/AcrR family transcriptional regulator C-terminal domain-containing protein [Actinomycetota bacterium]|nr:TetR/AcrR family transcriptional regulator C-terminal domain-containing protein [Actinomycetota bacterium]